ncbi:MAG: putative polyketide biosynthesis zinc-dependent hydrolase PksB [Verrucomicrobia subdivision 3 bacterium]|nr:putative polyketide biosynthesis zinc-dependent hydrolase PksB [Limisphaerales bacterium]MCS1417632.1 putative polyketide biosynthesis zinc-dependent hydrolase PksB [Limisphaerales bacterium]UWK15747.1 LasG [uncultured Verrucomicrobiota bacterium]UWK15768.1 LasG [uncultured Verrucomicrobiota bacterium]
MKTHPNTPAPAPPHTAANDPSEPQVHPIKVARGPFKNYCYLLTAPPAKESVLIDPAWEPHRIETALAKTQTQPTAILLTHAHQDHANLAALFSSNFSAPVYMSRQEIETSPFRCPNLAPLADATPIHAGPILLTPILTPGHTAGSMCFKTANSLFTGDTLFAEGCGMCLGNGANPKDMYRSLQKLKHTIPPHTKIFPGHSYGQSPGQPFSRLLKNNVYLLLDNPAVFVKYRMRKGQKGWLDFV